MVYPGSPLGEPSAERRRQLKRQVHLVDLGYQDNAYGHF